MQEIYQNGNGVIDQIDLAKNEEYITEEEFLSIESLKKL